MTICPTCASPFRELRNNLQWDGVVRACVDPWHVTLPESKPNTQTSGTAEIERLIKRFVVYATWKVGDYIKIEAGFQEAMTATASALRAIPALISDADNDRSRYKAQIEGLEREAKALHLANAGMTAALGAAESALAECERERDEARKSLEMLRHAIDDAYAAAKEKPDAAAR